MSVNYKLQIPSSKRIKAQVPMRFPFGIWCLDFGAYLLFGACYLVLLAIVL